MMKKPKVAPVVAKLDKNTRKMQKMMRKMNVDGQNKKRVADSSSDEDSEEHQEMEVDDHRAL